MANTYVDYALIPFFTSLQKQKGNEDQAIFNEIQKHLSQLRVSFINVSQKTAIQEVKLILLEEISEVFDDKSQVKSGINIDEHFDELLKDPKFIEKLKNSLSTWNKNI